MRLRRRLTVVLARFVPAREDRLLLKEPGTGALWPPDDTSDIKMSSRSAGEHGGRPLVGLPRNRARSVVWTSVVVAAFVASVLMLPLPEPDNQPPDLAVLLEHLQARQRTDLFSGRPPYVPEPSGPLSTGTPPTPLVESALVSKAILWADTQVPYLVPDTALPLRYHLDARLVQRFGLEEMTSAMEQWDGIPGSRWATEFVAVTDAPQRRPRADGTALVYLREDCRPGHLGGAFWNTAPGTAHLEARYGSAALYSSQIDLAICDTVSSVEGMRAIVAHEVGHMMGMAHLCEPGEICWQPGLDQPDRRCRVMFYRFGPCRSGVDEREHDAARHLYPTLPRLGGPTPAATSARASYATTWTHTASRVVVAPLDGSAYNGPLAAAVAGTYGAPLLLGEPDAATCLTGATAAEVVRAADNPATVVLVGTWPQVCEEALGAWDLRVERLAGEVAEESPLEPPTAALSVKVADLITEARRSRGELPESALLAVADGEDGSLFDAAAAASVAGRRGVPLLLTEPGGLSEPVARWLAEHPTVRRVQILGELDVISDVILDDLVELGLLVVRVPGRDHVDRSLRLAERERPFGRQPGADDPVVIASAGSVTDAVVGAGVAARLGAPLLFTTDEAHEGVLNWLVQHEPRGGYLVGNDATLPYPLQWAYTAHVAAAGEPAPSRRDTPLVRIGRPLTGHSGQGGPAGVPPDGQPLAR